MEFQQEFYTFCTLILIAQISSFKNPYKFQIASDVSLQNTVWHGPCLMSECKEGVIEMNFWVRELATINFFVIWLIIVGAFAVLKIIKSRLGE